jgi:hypothetical protein
MTKKKREQVKIEPGGIVEMDLDEDWLVICHWDFLEGTPSITALDIVQKSSDETRAPLGGISSTLLRKIKIHPLMMMIYQDCKD